MIPYKTKIIFFIASPVVVIWKAFQHDREKFSISPGLNLPPNQHLVHIEPDLSYRAVKPYFQRIQSIFPENYEVDSITTLLTILEDDHVSSHLVSQHKTGEMYKKHRLLEFATPKHEIPDQKLFIRHAEIHIRIERATHLQQAAESARRLRKTKLKLWIFQLVSGDFLQRGFDQVARFCTSQSVKPHALGWQKLDLTETVQQWQERTQPGEKLRLLIDCTGCGQNFVLYLFEVFNRSTQAQQRKTQQLQRKPLWNESSSRVAMKATGTYTSVHKLRKHRSRNKNWSSGKESQQLIFNNYKYKLPKESNDARMHNNINDHTKNKQESVAATEPVTLTEFHHLEDPLSPNRPFLVLHTEPKSARRVRRRVIDCAGALHGQCCKESFYVSFKALGWDDWIIAPHGYFANYCRGDCSRPYRTPDTFQTFHAHFIEEYRKLGLLNGMQPCCAPVKFSSMSLIYYGDDGIIKRDLPKMVVDECGCP